MKKLWGKRSLAAVAEEVVVEILPVLGDLTVVAAVVAAIIAAALGVLLRVGTRDLRLLVEGDVGVI